MSGVIRMQKLNVKRILLGVSGSIAAYKSVEIVRLLKQAGADVRVVMTPASQKFITPLSLQAVSGNIVRTKMFDADEEYALTHIDLAKWADLVLIAPATAGIASRICYATASDLLSTICLATTAPIVLAPAMNNKMWENWAVKNVFAQLTAHGIKLIGPIHGRLASGDEAIGKMVEPREIVREIMAM